MSRPTPELPTDGLVARDLPLVIPRAHDCITLFLGGPARYQQQFSDHPGTYWTDDFLIVQPGQTIKMVHDERVVSCFG